MTRKIIKILTLVAFFVIASNFSLSIHTSAQTNEIPNALLATPQISLRMTSASADNTSYQYGDNTSITNVLSRKDLSGSWMFKLYDIFKGFSNILLVIILFIFAFASILHINIDVYAIKKLLPKLIVIVLLINLALPIIAIFSVIVDRLQTISIFNSYKGIVGHSLPFYSQISAAWENFSWWDGIKVFFSTILAILPMVILLLLSLLVQLAVSLMLALRPFIIYLATAVSPLAIACALLPQTETFFKRWLKVIAFWMVYPLIVSVFAYVISLLPAFTYSQGFIGSALAVSIPMIIKIGFLWFLMKMPFSWEKDIGGLIASIPKAGAKVVAGAVLTAGGLYIARDEARKLNSSERKLQGGYIRALANLGGFSTEEEKKSQEKEKAGYNKKRGAAIFNEANPAGSPALTEVEEKAQRTADEAQATTEWDSPEKQAERENAARSKLINRKKSLLLDENAAKRKKNPSLAVLTPEAAEAQATTEAATMLANSSTQEGREKVLQELAPLSAKGNFWTKYKKYGGAQAAMAQSLFFGKDAKETPFGAWAIRAISTGVALTSWQANTREAAAGQARKMSLKESAPWSVNKITQYQYGLERAKGDLANADTTDAIRAANADYYDATYDHFCKLHGYDPSSRAGLAAFRNFIKEVNTANSSIGTWTQPEFDGVREVARRDKTSEESQIAYAYSQHGKVLNRSGRTNIRSDEASVMAYSDSLAASLGYGKPYGGGSAKDYQDKVKNGAYVDPLGGASGNPSATRLVREELRDLGRDIRGYAETSQRSITESMESFRSWARASNEDVGGELLEGNRRIADQLGTLGAGSMTSHIETATPAQVESLLRTINNYKSPNE